MKHRLLRLLPAAALALVALHASPAPAQAPATPQATPAQAAAPAIPWRTHKQVESAPLDSYVFVRARVVSIKPPDPGSRQPHSLYMQDDTGSMRVIIWGPVWDQIPNNAALQRGMIIDLYGRVSEFRGQRQVEIEQPTWIRMAPVEQKFLERNLAGPGFGQSEEFLEVSMGGITVSAIGERVLLRGEVTAHQPSTLARVPHRVTLKDGTGVVEVVWWEDVATNLREDQRPEVGKPYEIRGEVSEYAGNIQVKVLQASNIRRPDLEPAGPSGDMPAEAPGG